MELMKKRTTKLASAAIPALAALSAPSAHAAYVITFQQVGSDVIETGGGSLDLADLSVGAFGTPRDASVDPLQGRVFSGVFNGADTWFGEFEPESIVGFGTKLTTNASSTSGGPIGFASGVADLTYLIFPAGYVSGTPLSDSSTYLDATISSLGLTPGDHVWNWGSGEHADTFTIDVVAPPVPEPSTWAMMLLGFAGLGYAALRRNGGRADPA